MNAGNALKRHIRPAAKKLGIELGGWHDFRHTLATNLRKNGTHPVVVSGILGQSGITLAVTVYDRADASDLAAPLAVVANRLLPSCDQRTAVA